MPRVFFLILIFIEVALIKRQNRSLVLNNRVKTKRHWIDKKWSFHARKIITTMAIMLEQSLNEEYQQARHRFDSPLYAFIVPLIYFLIFRATRNGTVEKIYGFKALCAFSSFFFLFIFQNGRHTLVNL